MNDYKEHIKPELLVLVPVLYFIGLWLKESKVKDHLIPTILAGCSIFLSALYIISKDGWNGLSVFTAITQGILITGVSVFANQLVVQSAKKD